MKSNEVVYSHGIYDVVVIKADDETKVLGEDGNYHTNLDGYGVRNIQTGIIESTACSLAVNMFTCMSSDQSIKEFKDMQETKPKKSGDVFQLHAVDVPDDVVPN